MFKACAPPAVAARFDTWPSLQGSTFHAADTPEMSSDDAVRTKSAGGEKSINFYFIRRFFKKKVLKYGTPKPRVSRSPGSIWSIFRAPGFDGLTAANVNVGT